MSAYLSLNNIILRHGHIICITRINKVYYSVNIIVHLLFSHTGCNICQNLILVALQKDTNIQIKYTYCINDTNLNIDVRIE